MKNYVITVNGISYDVTVEEAGNSAPVRHTTPTFTPAQPAAAPAPAANGAKGSKSVVAGAAGKVLKIDVKVGDPVKSGQQVAVLEVMKMETPIVSSDDGVVASIETKEGENVEAGATLVTLN